MLSEETPADETVGWKRDDATAITRDNRRMARGSTMYIAYKDEVCRVDL